MYRLTHDPNVVLRVEDGTFIPLFDQEGAAQRAYVAWLGDGNSPQPVADPPLESEKAAMTAKIDADADAIRFAVIGARATEYQLANEQAQAFADAGYTGTVPEYVKSWVDAKAAGGVNWTAKQAADDILATAALWLSAQAQIRAHRLMRKEQVRAASDMAGISSAMTAWNSFASAVRMQLGISV
jgi:hypothetical protein